jgi:anti-anti-sigma regulatory factor
MSQYENMTKEQLLEEITRLNGKNNMLLSIMNGIDEIIYIADPDTHELLYINDTVKNIFGDVLGCKCYEAIQGIDSQCDFCSNNLIFGEYRGKPYVWEFQNLKNNEWYRCIDKAIPWFDGRMVRFELAINVTDLKKNEAIAREKVEHQAKQLFELSTPVIKVWDGIIVAPLIGNLDTERTQQFMERFLDTIVKTVSPIALIDITGVSEVDTMTAQSVIEAITAARLLGTNVILTGVNPGIAQTFVHLGIDLNDVETCSLLSRGLQIGLDFLGLKVVEKENDLGRSKENG